jgi:predicted aspartyl protease
MRLPRTAAVALAAWILAPCPLAPPALAQEACKLVPFPDIPVTFIRELPAVPVGLNGRYVYFLLDTGFSKTSVTPESQAQFQFPVDQRIHETSAGIGGNVTMPFALIKRFEFSGQTYINPNFPVVGLDQHLREQPGRPDLLSGAIGGDFLRNYDVEFDFAHRLMRLYQKPACYGARPGWTTRYETVAMRVTRGNTIVFPVRLGGNGLKAVFDSGATNLVLALASARSVGIDLAMLQKDKTATTLGAGGLSGTAWIHPIQGLEIGGERSDRLNLLIQDFNIGIADMLVGEPYIRTHKVWVSYAANLMFVQPPDAK